MNGPRRKLSRRAFKAESASRKGKPLPVSATLQVTGSFALIKPSDIKRSDPVVSCEAQKLPCRRKVRRRGCDGAAGSDMSSAATPMHPRAQADESERREREAQCQSLGAPGISARRRTLINHGANGRWEKLAKATPNPVAKCSGCASLSAELILQKIVSIYILLQYHDQNQQNYFIYNFQLELN